MTATMRVLARAERFALGLAFAFCGGCLVENPAFVDTSLQDAGDDGAACSLDEREPDDEESIATALGPLNDDAPVLSIEAAFEDATAQDWFTFVGQATSGLAPQPWARVTTTSGEGASVCVFIECSGGVTATEAVCPDPAAEHTHTMGLYRPGCCALEESRVEPTCMDGALDDMTILVRVAPSGSAVACDDYVLDLEF